MKKISLATVKTKGEKIKIDYSVINGKKLRPCPACGGDGQLIFLANSSRYEISCHCGLSVSKKNWEHAVRTWNKL